MKRFLFLLCIIISIYEVRSQVVVASDIQGINCNDSIGHIYLSTDIPAIFFAWYHFDTVGDSTQLQYYSDSLETTVCGKYRVEIYNSSGVITDTRLFFIPCPLSTSEAQQNVQCAGDSTGMLRRVAYAGSPPYFYKWYKNGNLFSSGLNDTLFSNLVASQYSIVVIDSIGCVDSSFANIFEPNALRVDSLNIDSVECYGDSTGSFLVNVKDGKRYSTDYYDYYLVNSNLDTISFLDRTGISSNISSMVNPYIVQFNNLPAGNYTLVIVDSFSCVLDTQITILSPDPYILHVTELPPLVCSNDSTWLQLDSITGGNNNLMYVWETNFNDSIYVSTGSYNVIVTDLVYGCKDTLQYHVSAQKIIECLVSITDVLCYGENTGRLEVDTCFGGTSPYIIQWGGINPDSLFAGSYTLLVTDSLGCTYLNTFTVNQTDNIDLNETLYSPSCHGFSDGSISIDVIGGNMPLVYNWLNGTGNPDSLYALSSGWYFLETQDSLGCVYLDSIFLAEPDEIQVSFLDYTNPLSCYGGTTLINTNITGGTGNYQLLWNTGSISDTNFQIIVSSGNYILDVSDDNGCSASKQIIITEPDLLTMDLTYNQGNCNSLGTASVSFIGGTSPIEVIWSNGSTTYSIQDLVAGNYWVIAIDSCGNIDSSSFLISEYILNTEIYYGDSNSAYVEVNNSTVGPPYTYQWYEGDMSIILGETDSIILDLCEGWYFVHTLDSNLCEAIDSIEILFNFPMGGIINESTTSVYPDSLLWSAEPYTYLWDNGDVTRHADLCPGFHRVWVTDANDCEVVGDITIPDFEISLSPEDIIVECDIQNLDVELSVNINGGTGNYSYYWDNGDTVNPIQLSINPGIYRVTVIDENDCQIDTSFHIAALTAECIPNVFTPNNDGVNDTWNLEDAFFYSDSDIRIYNRYGRRVFKSIGYEQPWDGTNENGNSLPDGTYFYIIKLSDGEDRIRGSVTIMR